MVLAPYLGFDKGPRIVRGQGSLASADAIVWSYVRDRDTVDVKSKSLDAEATQAETRYGP